MAAGVGFGLLNYISSGKSLTNRDINFLLFSLTKKRSFQASHFTFSPVINQSTQNNFLWPDFNTLYADLDDDSAFQFSCSFTVLRPVGSMLCCKQ